MILTDQEIDRYVGIAGDILEAVDEEIRIGAEITTARQLSTGLLPPISLEKRIQNMRRGEEFLGALQAYFLGVIASRALSFRG